jgi:S1-C subfamily serine protease
MQTILRILILSIVMTAMGACRANLLTPWQGDHPNAAVHSILRVTVTSQGYFFHRPWEQRRPITQTAIGAIVSNDWVLVTARLVANHRYIELETIDTRKKTRAEVAVVDYEANLALLKPVNPNFLSEYTPLKMAGQIAPEDELTILQVKPNGDILPSTGRILSIELRAFTYGNLFLAYRLSNGLQYGYDNLTLPVVKGRALAGLVLQSDSGKQTIDVIATSVIQHFLNDALDGEYEGFPLAGFLYGPTLDPQLRRYIKLQDHQTGIYIQKVLKGGPADRADLHAGDVITRMGGVDLSNTGQFNHPQYGQTSLIHLIRSQHYVNEMVPLQVVRDGKPLSLTIRLDHRRPEEYLVPPYLIDQAPDYLIFGGLIFQELSVSYLREYGKDWNAHAPIHLLYYNQNQDYLSGDQREKIVIISGVIPTPYTIGFENMAELVVQQINGQPIGKLADVAAAFKTPLNNFHKIEVEQHPKVIFLDPKQIPQIHKNIQERYRIPMPSQ